VLLVSDVPVRALFISADERAVGESELSVDELLPLKVECALLMMLPSWTLVVLAICPQPCPCERRVRTPGKRELALELAVELVLVVLLPAAASGPPISAACH
jgi:hypothetical protein